MAAFVDLADRKLAELAEEQRQLQDVMAELTVLRDDLKAGKID